MVRSAILYEGNRGRRLPNLAQMNTDSRYGFRLIPWVPAVDYIGTYKFISENGTYKAADEPLDSEGNGIWAYTKVNVNVAGGAAGTEDEIDDDEQMEDDEYDETEEAEEGSSDLPQEVEPSPDGKIIGKDENGKPVEVIAKDGKLETREVKWPCGIKITKLPNLLQYGQGETIDLTGIEVQLVDYKGDKYTDERYPDGNLPLPAIWTTNHVFTHALDPLPTGVYDIDGSYTPDASCIQVGSGTNPTVELNYIGFNKDGVRYVVYWNGERLTFVSVSSYSHTQYHLQTIGTTTTVEGTFSSSSSKVEGITYKVASGDWSTPMPTPVNSVSEATSKAEATRLAMGLQKVVIAWPPIEYGIGGYYYDEFWVGERIGSNDSSGVNWDWFING